ncbi:MAG TPA: glycosyltransferase family 2 protein [Dehalococcoidia bacterium]|nr:glycosyltransferase family 2 protein [Dehalococcoidia bacterium]
MNGRSVPVSVALPVYNGEQFLAEAIESVLAQTFGDFELLICDNASTDATPHICQMYASRDRRVRYYGSDKNRGASWNFNRAFGLASGQYFKWIAADDYLAPTFLERCLMALNDRPEAVLAYPNAVCVDESGGFLHDYNEIMDQGLWHERAVYRFRRLLNEFERNGGTSANAYVFGLIRTSALRRTDLLGNYIAADLGLVAHLVLLGPFVEVPEHLSFIRAHEGSSSWFRAAGWSLDRAQRFFDPTVRGRLALAISVRRRHYEYCRAAFRTPLPIDERARVVLSCAEAATKRLERRLAPATARERYRADVDSGGRRG